MRAPVRLRTHSIGNYARPDTEAPRTTLALALLAAAGVMLPWVEGFGWSKRGWSYEHGLVALGAAIGAACRLRSLRADRKDTPDVVRGARVGVRTRRPRRDPLVLLRCRRQHRYGPLAAAVRFFGVRVVGAVGLYISMTGFLGQLSVLVWHLDFVIRRRATIALESPWTVAALLAVAAVGVLLPWTEDPAERGWSFNEGSIALVAAMEAGIVCGLRLSGHIKLVPYAIVGLLGAAVGLAAVIWFHNAVCDRSDGLPAARLVAQRAAINVGRRIRLRPWLHRDDRGARLAVVAREPERRAGGTVAVALGASPTGRVIRAGDPPSRLTSRPTSPASPHRLNEQ